MNIGFEAKRFFTNYTGLGNYSRFVVDALSSFYPSHQYYLFTPRAVSHPELSALVNRSNVNVVTPAGLYRIFPSLWRTWAVRGEKAMGNLHVYHGLSQELPLDLPDRVKKIVTVHDLIYFRFPQFYNAVDVAIYKAKVKSACQRADRIIAISNQTAQDLVHFIHVDPAKIDVVYQGCHPNFKRSIDADEILRVKKKYNLPDRYLLNVGTIEERKNLIVLVKAMAQLPESQRLPLVVIGRQTKYFEQVRNEAHRLGVLNHIIFLHQTAFVDFPAIYKGALVFVYPSLFEGFGIPLIEAITCGVPVITSTGSCFSEAAGPSAKYADPSSPEDLATQLKIVLSDAALRQDMVKQSGLFIRKFEPEVIAADLDRIYSRP
jgi:glycosyltransferase involved in cell wall biosynthesis